MAKQVDNSMYLRFYEECLNNKINDLNSEKNIERAKLIAKKLNINNTNIQEVYQIAVEEKNKQKRILAEIEMQSKIRANQSKDKELYLKYTKYSNLKGKEKPVTILQEELQPLLEEYRKEAANLGISFQEKEKDWAILGGIANGLAGGAAGLAVALDVQAKNAQIREKNRELILAEAYYKEEVRKRMNKIEAKINEIKNKIEAYNLKLQAKDSDDEVFSHLSITDIEYFKTEASSLVISAKIALKEPYIIYDDIIATVDGTLFAAIFYDNYLIGVADMVLPNDGLKNKSVKLEAISLYLLDNKNIETDRISIKIGPKYLWAIE